MVNLKFTVGNTHKRIENPAWQNIGRKTYKIEWSAFVRLPKTQEDIIFKVRFGLHQALGGGHKDVFRPPFEVSYKHWVDFTMPVTIFWKGKKEPTKIFHQLYFWDEG